MSFSVGSLDGMWVTTQPPQLPVQPVDPSPRVGEDSRSSLDLSATFSKRQSMHEQRLASLPSPKGVGGNIDCFC